jgi:lysophospholipase L1-like esterase
MSILDAPIRNNTISPRIQAFGDSRASYCGLNVNQSNAGFANPARRYPSTSPIAWCNRFLRQRLNFDVTLGYAGQFQAVYKVIVVSGGSNYSNAASVSFSGGSGSGAVFGTPVVVNGVIQSVAVTTPGTGFTSLPTLTVTDGTGSGANLLAVIGGTGTFGNAGETSTQCVNRLSDIVASPVDIVYVQIGTNDITNNVTAAATKANLKTIFDTLISAGKLVIYTPDQPRSYWAALSAPQIVIARKQMYDVRRWVYDYALLANGVNTTNSRKIIIAEFDDFWADATSSTGDPQTIMTSDGLHWSQASAQCAGLRLARQLQPLLGIDSNNPPMTIISQADVYDVTSNPKGVLNFGWLMNATSAAPTAPLTGLKAGNFNAFRVSGSATGTMACSIESTRTDGLSGNRQVITFSLGSGTNAEKFSFGITNSLLSTYNINVGDTIVVECDIWLSGQANVNVLLLELNITNGGTTVIQAYDGDTTRSVLPASGAYLALSGDSTPMTFKTPPIVIPAGATNFTCYATIGLDASGGAGSATAVWKIGNFRIRKII